MSIEVDGVSKRFGGFVALDDVSLEVPAGELVALLGPSGSGKTTLLRVIAGLEAPDRGTVRLGGELAAGDVRRRGVGFVFQHYALFRHMTVFENVAFGLRVRPRRERPAEAEIRRRVGALLGLVQLGALAGHRPGQLSGGQRQRVALARALAVEPKVLLLDEPFGALDAKVRQELRRWLRRLHDELHVTSVFVTHDQEEALEVADRIVVMHAGRIEQVGSPEQVYDQPASPFVFQFLGRVNIFRGRFGAEGEAGLAAWRGWAAGGGAAGQGGGGEAAAGAGRGGAAVAAGIAGGPAAVDGAGGASGGGAVAYVRPHDLRLLLFPEAGAVEAVIRRVRALGPLARVELERLDTGEALEAELARDAFVALDRVPGDTVYVVVRKLRVFAGA